MAIIRVQSILKSTTGMARDNCVNTWHFEGLVTEANLLAIDDAVDDFFRSPVDTGETVDFFLSTAVLKVQNKIYDVTDEPAGPPLLVSAERDLTAGRSGTVNLPEEVACCLSFAGTPEAGLDQSRRRGRVYIGPLRDSAFAYTVGQGVRVTNTFRDTLLKAGRRMAQNVDPAAEFVVYSRPYAGRGEIVRPGRSTLPAIAARPGNTVNVDEFSVDNAPDTQRRRGIRPTVRTMVSTEE